MKNGSRYAFQGERAIDGICQGSKNHPARGQLGAPAGGLCYHCSLDQSIPVTCAGARGFPQGPPRYPLPHDDLTHIGTCTPPPPSGHKCGSFIPSSRHPGWDPECRAPGEDARTACSPLS